MPELSRNVPAPLRSRSAVRAGVSPAGRGAEDRAVARPPPRRDRPAGAGIDLLFHLPYGGVSRDPKGSIVEAPIGEPVTLAVTVALHRPAPPGRSRAPYKVLVEDETGDVTLVFFIANERGSKRPCPWARAASSRASSNSGTATARWSIPTAFSTNVEPPTFPPLKPSTAHRGPILAPVSRFISTALDRVPNLPEWQDETWLKRNDLPHFADALQALHRPAEAAQATEEAIAASPARRRLGYDELLASQLALALVRSRMRRLPGRVNAGDGRLVERLQAALPFGLTGAQARAVADIRSDLVSHRRMLRLLQGDVGSGKTVVALLAMASVVEAGRQAALMAPTEILARQHFERIAAARPTRRACASRCSPGATRGERRAHAAGGSPPATIDIADRHPRAVPGGRRVPRSWPRRGRRAASLRRPSAPRARRQGRGCRHSGDDGDADPAHARAHLFRRHGCVGAATRSRPAASRSTTRACRSSASTRSSPAIGRAIAGGRARLLGVPAGRGIRELIDLAAAEDRYADLKQRLRRQGRPRAWQA